MNSDILVPHVKCLFLELVYETIPMETLRAPVDTVILRLPLYIELLEDEFEILIVKKKVSENVSGLEIGVYRWRENPNEKYDDGYALRFYISVAGFEEHPRFSIMNHGDGKAEPAALFTLSESILSKINSTHYVFDVFVVFQMLEMKNVAEENMLKKVLDHFMCTILRPQLTEKECHDLCFILNCSSLEDAFTGRLPKSYTDEILYYITFMGQNYSEVVKYLIARHDERNPDADISKILKYVDLEDDHGPRPFDEALNKYMKAHKIGFDCMKAITADYLLRFVDDDSSNVLFILEMALTVHDQYLFNKAMFSFLNNFQEIIRSKAFKSFSDDKGCITRLIIHSARFWMTVNDVYIPGWKQYASTTKA